MPKTEAQEKKKTYEDETSDSFNYFACPQSQDIPLLCFGFFLSSSAKHKDSIPKVFNKKDGSTARG